MFRGVVKSWNREKGWGHIECDETHKLYGKDVFLLRSALNGGDIIKGTDVVFNVVNQDKGPYGTDIQIAGAGPRFVAQPMNPLMQNHLGMPAMAPSAVPGVEDFLGVVKSWNPVKGWGHITCDVTSQIYGKDMFFMKSQLLDSDIVKGATVRFQVAQGLKDVEAASIQRVRSPDMVYYGTVKTYHEEKGWGHIDCAQSHTIYNKDMFFLKSSLNGHIVSVGDPVTFRMTMGLKGPEATYVRPYGGLYSGSIKQYDAQKGFGFIACEQTRDIFGKDIFLHRKDLGDYVPQVGDFVQFAVSIGAGSRPEATQLGFPSQTATMYGAVPFRHARAKPY